MPRGRKPKPARLRVLQGNREKRPLPKNKLMGEPSLPAPPDHLSAEARDEWERVAVQLYNIGALMDIDRAALAAYCQSYGRWVQAECKLADMAARDEVTAGLMIRTTNGNAVQNPLVGTANKAMHEMMRYAAEFGMTPSSRMRVDAPTKEAKGKFAGLLAS